jgi:hypothetical protein
MKQLTDEIRLQIFQQNIGCEVMSIETPNFKFKMPSRVLGGLHIKSLKTLSILKRPLSSITDEEAKEVTRILKWKTDSNYHLHRVRDFFKNIEDYRYPPLMILRLYQYLHSRGFAMSYLDWSVEELIKENVYKIIT